METNLRPPAAGLAMEKHGGLWMAAIVLMGICVIATFWYPLLSIEALPSRNYNEGWNAYRQWMTVQGQPLYGARNALWTTNYPFLSFHIIGLLGRTKANMVLTGRIVSFASLLAVASCFGGMVRGATGSWRSAVYGGLLLMASLAAYDGSARVADDPEMLSAAFASFGLFAAWRATRGLPWLALAGLAFSCSLFTKHDYIAFPLSVAVYLLFTHNWRGLAVFGVTGVAASAALLALSFHLDGQYFFAEFLAKRAYASGNLFSELWRYLLHFSVPLGIAAVALWWVRGIEARGFLLTLLLFTHLLAIGFAGGDGVAANVFYPALIADLLTCIMAICRLQRDGSHFFKPALLVISCVTAIIVPFQVHTDIASQRRLPGSTAAARQAIALLQTLKGPAICEDILLCYEAGKPLDYDPYYVRDQIVIGHEPEAGIVALLQAQHYAAIQADVAIGGAKWHPMQHRFTPKIQQTILAAYRPAIKNLYYLILIPK